MKKFILILCLLFLAINGFSQQFSQYNTGTLFDSFENPSQRAFVPDSSRTFASNFFIPNFDANFLLKGNAQASLVSRAFGDSYNNSALQIGSGNYNHTTAVGTAYLLMLKMFTSFNGDQEVGFFINTKGEGRGAFTDESVALFDGSAAFPNNIYDNLFNDHYNYQLYTSIGLTYKEKLSSQFTIGFKLGALMGINYNKLDIDESHVNFNKLNDNADIALRGRYYLSKGPGSIDAGNFLPSFQSPGAQLSIGTSYLTEDGIIIQGNIKDLGFIHWFSSSKISDFNSSTTVNGLTTAEREQNMYDGINSVISSAARETSFTSYTNALFELSATKSFYLDNSKTFKYAPTLIASKELLYNGFIGALVNDFQYDDFHVGVTGTYDNYNLFKLGLQLMYKTPNVEFFMGSDRLGQTIGLANAKSSPDSYTNGSFTGADFFLGFSIKFGRVIEHPLNASVIPTGEKGFLGNLWNRFFKAN
jgi:hypothetical protein